MSTRSQLLGGLTILSFTVVAVIYAVWWLAALSGARWR